MKVKITELNTKQHYWLNKIIYARKFTDWWSPATRTTSQTKSSNQTKSANQSLSKTRKAATEATTFPNNSLQRESRLKAKWKKASTSNTSHPHPIYTPLQPLHQLTGLLNLQLFQDKSNIIKRSFNPNLKLKMIGESSSYLISFISSTNSWPTMTLF